eukprot:TRINITY_DN662_c0_g2_i1.p1 TRINITY_DN662_c0_g2~~TRINITY_DN662_c0_g2_i1.p1  ORF type:complete len:740 (-),score=154.89 TRINITY_DN662_c0_g2_i1:366-2585(-)
MTSLCQRLEGREGLIRDLFVKRVNFSARTVVTPDPALSIDEIGVPFRIAAHMTYPEIVNRFNIKRLQELVHKIDQNEHSITIKKNSHTHQLNSSSFSNNLSNVFLEPGDIVERPMQEGDLVVMSHQDTRRSQIRCHKVRLFPGSAFRLSPSLTSSYNVSFGDEMNLHFPQSLATHSETSELLLASQIGCPIGFDQEVRFGSKLLAWRDTFLEKNVLMNLLLFVDTWDGRLPIPAVLKPRPLWTGKQIFSLVLPRVNLIVSFNSSSIICPNDSNLRIDQGELLTGWPFPIILGPTQRGLVHAIRRIHGDEEMKSFIDQWTMVVNSWLLQQGFTFGFEEVRIDESTAQEIETLVTWLKGTVNDLDHRSLVRGLPKEVFERELRSIFETGASNAQTKVHDFFPEINQEFHLVEMSCFLGQQFIQGERIPFGFQERTLPHFTKLEGTMSRGFIESSYLSGLKPAEFFWEAMSSRSKMVRNTVNTFEMRVIQKRLIKAMQDLQVCYDSTVRNSRGDVIQFIYGEDGLDEKKTEFQKLETLRLEKDAFFHRFFVSDDVNHPSHSEFQQLLEDQKFLRTELFWDRKDERSLPVNLQALILTAQKKSSLRDDLDLDHAKIIGSVSNLCDRLKVVHGSDPISREQQHNASLLFKCHIRSILASKPVLEEYRLSSESFHWILTEIERRFLQSIFQPGEMPGVIVGQSLREPASEKVSIFFRGQSEEGDSWHPTLERASSIEKTNRNSFG